MFPSTNTNREVYTTHSYSQLKLFESQDGKNFELQHEGEENLTWDESKVSVYS